MKATFWDCLRAAFNARPIGMFIPPNWVGLALVGLLGLVNPGFWVAGAGLELGYLFALAHNRRFQRLVAAQGLAAARYETRQQVQGLIAQLPPADQVRYHQLERRCQTILEQQSTVAGPGAGAMGASGLQAQAEGLGRMTWIFLRLLLTRDAIGRVLRESADADADELHERIARLKQQAADPALGEDLRKSLTGQADILQQRLERQQEARNKLAFLDAELTRIQEQVELLREQAVVSTDPESVSQRIDQIATTLGGTTQWIQEQQQVYGKVEDLMADPIPLSVPAPAPSAKASSKIQESA
jgi:hypothetical protein